MADIGTQYPSSEPARSSTPSLVGQWSWAGFIFSWLYLIAHNHVGLGIGLLVAMIVLGWIPFLNFLVFLGVMIFAAIKGHEYAWSGGVYKDGEQFSVSHRVLNTMGKVWFFIALVLGVVMGILWLTVFAAMFAARGALGGASGFPVG